MTTILPVQSPDDPAITHAAALLRAGELVAFPTETVYGLGANAFDAQAVAKIFVAKGRPATDPLIVHISDHAMLDQVVSAVTPLAEQLSALWPAPLTLVLRRHPQLPATISAGLGTVGVRMPSHPIALALIRAAGVPIAAPSANRFAHTSPTSAQHVYDDLKGKIALILDGGDSPVGVESSIVDCSASPPRLLRPGGLAVETIRQFAPDLEIVAREVGDDEAMPAPGMLLRHYSPDVPVILFEGPDAAVRHAIRERMAVLIAEGVRVGLLIADEDRPLLAHANAVIASLGTLSDLAQVARRLYAALRELEAQHVQVILARSVVDDGPGLAVRDRLRRAAAGKVVSVPPAES